MYTLRRKGHLQLESGRVSRLKQDQEEFSWSFQKEVRLEHVDSKISSRSLCEEGSKELLGTFGR